MQLASHKGHTLSVPLSSLKFWFLTQKLAAARPRWIDHLLLNEIFDGDMAYLAQASTNSKRRDGFGNSWAQDYYLPARADG